MDIKQIREGLQSLSTIDASALEPKRLAEGLTRMQELHRDTAALVAQDSKLSWDGQMLHDDLSKLEGAWTAAAKAPAATATKLQEQQTRTLKVLKEVGRIGVAYRQKLQENLKVTSQKEALVTEVAKRGNGWRQKALRLEARNALVEKRLRLTYQVNEELVRRYHEDTTALARHALIQEQKPGDEKILQRLKEATRVRQITAIREELTGKKETSVLPGKTLVGALREDKKAATSAPVTPPPANIVSTVRPFTISESVQMTKRLSEASRA